MHLLVIFRLWETNETNETKKSDQKVKIAKKRQKKPPRK